MAPRGKPPVLDAYANEVRLGDRVAPAELPGPHQLPRWIYGHSGEVVSLGRVRVGVRFEDLGRTELLPSRPLLVIRAGDGRVLSGPPPGEPGPRTTLARRAGPARSRPGRPGPLA